MNEHQGLAVENWIKGEMNDAEFCEAYGVLAADWPAEVSWLIDSCSAAKNAKVLEYALCLHSHFCSDLELGVEFARLITQTWHFCHETMIRHFQDFPSEASVAPLKNAIALKPSLDYLDYDDYGAYYKKCLWALAVNPCPEALQAIKQCAASQDDVLRAEALYRLRRLGIQSETIE